MAAAFHEALRRLRTNLGEGRPLQCGDEKVLVRTGGSYLSENADYSQENYHRRRRQRAQGFLAPDYLPYRSVGVVQLDPLDLVEGVVACDLRPRLTAAPRELKVRRTPAYLCACVSAYVRTCVCGAGTCR